MMMSENHSLPLTDSAWFWVLVFALMAEVALFALAPKYARRQGQIETRYEARERIARGNRGEIVETEVTTGKSDQPRAHIISLWPLHAIVVAAVLLSVTMLVRRHSLRKSHALAL
jgi:hypothetical protein